MAQAQQARRRSVYGEGVTSLAARLIPTVMVLRGTKLLFSSAARMRARIEARASASGVPTPPRGLTDLVEIRLFAHNGWMVYEISPKTAGRPSESSAGRALYLHGGAYVFEIALQHWQLVANLVVSANTRITLPIYPLAPIETAGTIVPKATDLAAALIAEAGSAKVSLIGDSAGGGMALAVAMELRNRGLPALHRIVLISPWLDISGTDPALQLIAPSDPWLAVAGSREAGRFYRGSLPEDHPTVSPIHGDLSGLGPITMFSGTRDILNADARRLMRLAAAAGIAIDYHEEVGMIHVYPLLPIPEGRVARGTITAALRL